MSVYRPRKSPYYHFDFSLGGRRFHGSTRRTARSEALAVEKAERARAVAALAAEASADRTEINAVWARFWAENGVHDKDSATTFYRMERLQDGLAAILRSRGRRSVVAAIDDDVVAEYVARARGAPVVTRMKGGRTRTRLRSPADVNRDVQLLRRILRRAHLVWKLPLRLPAWGALLLPEPEERIVVMPRAREAALIAAMREDFRPAARFLILSGLRRGNVLPLHPSAVDFESGTITLSAKSRRPGGRTIVLPITRAMLLILANEIGKHPEAVFTFVARATRKSKDLVRGRRYPIAPRSFLAELKRAARAIGAPTLRVHDLRHVAGTRTLAATGNLRAVQQQLGHSRIATTAKYAHILIDETRAAMELAHQIPGNSPGPLDDDAAKSLPPKTDAAGKRRS